VYSSKVLLDNYRAYDKAFGDLPHTVCYAVKPTRRWAFWPAGQSRRGFDIVSGGELFRVLRAGGDPRKVVFSGVGKTASEVEYALTHASTVNCESEAELVLIDALAGG